MYDNTFLWLTVVQGTRYIYCLFCNHNGLKKRNNVESFESCCIHFRQWGVEDELRSLTAWGVKLLCILLMWQQILMYLLSDGSSVNRQWLGGHCLLVSFGFSADISLHLCFVDGTSDVVLITCWRSFMSLVMHGLWQFVMFPVRMLSIAPL